MSREYQLQVYILSKVIFVFIIIFTVVLSGLILRDPVGFINSLNMGIKTGYGGYYFYAGTSISYLLLLSILSIFIAYDPIKYRNFMIPIIIGLILNGAFLLFMSHIESGVVFIIFSAVDFILASAIMLLYYIHLRSFRM
mgnify:CR=1 FL=1